MAENWIEEMIEREITPRKERTETVLEFCARHGIAENTYYYNVRKEDNQKRIIELSLSVAKAAVPEILEVLVGKAKDGDMKAIDTYLDSVAKLAKNIDIQSGGKPLPILNLNAILTDNSNSKDSETE